MTDTPTDAQCAQAYANYVRDVQDYLMDSGVGVGDREIITGMKHRDQTGVTGGALSDAFSEFTDACKAGESLADAGLPFGESVLSDENYRSTEITNIRTR